MNDLSERLLQVRQQIAAAAERVERDPTEVTLIGVTKTWPAATLQAAYRAGLRHFGENRTHELAEKRPIVEQAGNFQLEDPIIWHFIGHLQSRQSQAVADHADLFHAADRPKILRRLGHQLEQNGRTLTTLLEVNISGESTKGGFPADRWENDPHQVAALVEAIRITSESTGLRCTGLMTMAPWGASESIIRSVFTRTRRLRDCLSDKTAVPLPMLSMGMSDDFAVAIEEGATHVRVGRAIFGERN